MLLEHGRHPTNNTCCIIECSKTPLLCLLARGKREQSSSSGMCTKHTAWHSPIAVQGSASRLVLQGTYVSHVRCCMAAAGHMAWQSRQRGTMHVLDTWAVHTCKFVLIHVTTPTARRLWLMQAKLHTQQHTATSSTTGPSMASALAALLWLLRR